MWRCVQVCACVFLCVYMIYVVCKNRFFNTFEICMGKDLFLKKNGIYWSGQSCPKCYTISMEMGRIGWKMNKEKNEELTSMMIFWNYFCSFPFKKKTALWFTHICRGGGKLLRSAKFRKIPQNLLFREFEGAFVADVLPSNGAQGEIFPFVYFTVSFKPGQPPSRWNY
jgi:hypothetical protein